MIVLDASALLEILLARPAGLRALPRLLGGRESLHAPHLIDVEVAQTLRRYAAAGQLPPPRDREALDDLADFPLHRYPHGPLLSRIWDLRSNLTAHDAAYVALAEALDAPLLTADRRLASAPGHRARVETI
ncbi:MAG TPA: type II toxin-antitoxin system VapC family toxin [Vicinamibacteria bacterium]|nr:type II toxin-antitoxin system VapC family toxin [Vicinamibacteria bacterium]